MPRDKLKVITPAAEPAAGYVLDEQVGFLMRVADAAAHLDFHCRA